MPLNDELDKRIAVWLVRCLDHEGGYWNDPVGGPTKWGISQRSYPDLYIPGLTVEAAVKIYRRDYIHRLRAEHYPHGVGFQLFDFGVHSGPKTAIIKLQQIIGVKPDGWVGPITLAALEHVSDSDLVMLIVAERLDFMADLKNFLPNARGWVRRMARNLRYGAEDT